MTFRVLMVIVFAWILADAACTGDGPTSPGDAGAGGTGGSGPCKSNEVVVQQLVPTDTVCDLEAPVSQCEDFCEIECLDNDFELGSRGSGCAREDDTAYCRCVCAYCRAA
ncbi:MAG: hypothetical protein WCE62_02955 [Polyangiales bacterium]